MYLPTAALVIVFIMHINTFDFPQICFGGGSM